LRDRALDPRLIRPHAWHIAAREYARQESRRGRRHAYTRLTPAATALVVIDMVPFFAAESATCQGIVPNINALAAALRGAGGLVAWVLPGPPRHPTHHAGFYGETVAALYATSGGTGPPATRLWPALNHAPADIFAEKSGASAFFPGNSSLPDDLAARAIDTVLIAGTVTNVCCESSARDASASGLRTILLADACAARTDAEHNAALHTIYRSFGDVRPAADILALIDEAVRS
jgi:nicotinamidase-related amidase